MNCVPGVSMTESEVIIPKIFCVFPVHVTKEEICVILSVHHPVIVSLDDKSGCGSI
jgi:hypothetical protein